MSLRLNLASLIGSLIVFLILLDFFYNTLITSVAYLPISNNSLWALFYFAYYVYSFFLISLVIYVFSNILNYTRFANASTLTNFNTNSGDDFTKLVLWFLIMLIITHSSYSGPVVTAWFGHLVFSQFQFKFTYLLYFFFLTYVLVFLTTSHATSLNFFDYLGTIFHFFLWIWLLTFSNNLFTFVFFLEILSATITLLLVSSTFSSSYFHHSLSLTKHSYFNFSTPSAYLQTLMFFFWITLVSSLMLFIFTLTFYLNFFSFDLSLISSIFTFIITTATLKNVFSIALSWLFFMIAITIKCGLLPFFFWKPTFFKGMTLQSLFFYIYVYYFTVFFMFIYLLYFYTHELFLFYLTFTLGITLIGSFGLLSLIFESYYLKAFLAISSILNSTLIFYGLCGFQTIDTLLNL